jgi:ABC-type sugar transport system permease subunit
VTAAPSTPPRARRIRRRRELLPYALLAPIALLLIAISVYPGLYAIWLAMTDASLLRLARAQFIGIGNFVRMAGDEIFLHSLWRTLRWDVAVVGIELAIALPIALLLNRQFRGRGFVRVAMMIPYITLPHLLPSILFLVLLRVIWMSNHIDMIFVLTQGGPGFSNYTAAVYSFKLTSQFEIGYASAVAVVLTILLVAASAMYVRHLARKVLVTA